MRNLCYENDFDLHENETTCRTNFHMKGFALRLALKQRHKGTRKWPILLYSWRFSRYSAPIHWLVHGHMTSNNETVSRQTPWAGNIAKTMTSNGKQFTVTLEMLTAVARDRWNLSAVFKFCFCFVLLNNKSLNDWSLGEQWKSDESPLQMHENIGPQNW